MKKCVVYIRKSTEAKHKGITVKAQVRAVKTLAKKNGYKITEMFEESKDEPRKPALQYLLEKAKEEKIKTIICGRGISRVINSFCDSKQIYQFIKENGIKIITPKNL